MLWVGTGEGDPRNSVGYGWGVYRSVDGGQTWKNLGLKKTEQIKRIVVDPSNPYSLRFCALQWGPNKERGVFKTTDGGKTWDKVLFIDENTGFFYGNKKSKSYVCRDVDISKKTLAF